MNTLSLKTVSVSREEALQQKEWVVIDAEGQILGRMCSKCGDNVIIINAAKVQLTGKKMTDREYVRYTGYPGGQRFTTPEQLLAKSPEAWIRKVVKGMLPKNHLGERIITHLYVFAGAEHNMQAQQPKQLDINTIK